MRKYALSTQDIAGGIRAITGNPLGAAALTGAGIWGLSKWLHKPITDIGRSTAQSFGMLDPEEDELDKEEMNSAGWRKWLPIALGGVAAGGVLAATADPNDTFFGWHHWGGPRVKTASYSFNGNDQIDVDFGQLVPVRDTKSMVLNNPFLEPFQKGDVVSVINDASNKEGGDQVSLGGVFDSAVNRIQDNLSFSGITGAATRYAVGWGMGKALTSAIGTVMDLSPKTRNQLQTAAGFANVVSHVFL